ncbi:MAG: hypothetical protein AAFY71_16310 [Bacteroidota bacterium]
MENKNTLSNRPSLGIVSMLTVGIGAIILAIILFNTTSSIPEISGIINDYAQVSRVNQDTVVLVDPSAFSVGDGILLIQMQGAQISTANDSTYGDVTNWQDAGVAEFGEIQSISGNTLVLEEFTCNTYDLAQAVQVVRIPEYDSVSVIGTLTAQPWNGQTGGVVALAAKHRIRLFNGIDVSGAGFRGGSFNGSSSGRNMNYTCALNSGAGGNKGEGISAIGLTGCIGKLANGGGGGNDHNGGGGGGSNYGKGGRGGHGWLSNSPPNLSDMNKGGRGGASLANVYGDPVIRMFMGGGGGGGHQNNGASFPGGNGGGVVFIQAPELRIEAPVVVDASGKDAMDIFINDGASGGGAGGSVFLNVDDVMNASSLTIDVSGGDGADVNTLNQHGPGGGGGGGAIVLKQALPVGLTYSLAEGRPGLFRTNDSSNVHRNTPHGARPGEVGGIVSNSSFTNCTIDPSFPVEWLYFKAVPQQENIKLEWGTATETNSHHFEIERSLDNSSFLPIGSINAAGNSTRQKNYIFIDGDVMKEGQEKAVYRLKQVDMDGQFNYSSLVSINLEEIKSDQPQITFLTPSIGGMLQIKVVNPDERGGSMILRDIRGKQLLEKGVSEGQLKEVSLDVSQFPSGIYVLTYRSSSFKVSKKIRIENN